MCWFAVHPNGQCSASHLRCRSVDYPALLGWTSVSLLEAGGGSAGNLEGHALVGAEGDAECAEIIDIADLLSGAHVGDDGPGRQHVGPDAACHWLGAEVQGGDLECAAAELLDHYQHAACRDIWYGDLPGGGDVEFGPYAYDFAKPAGEGVLTGELLIERAVEGPAARDPGRRPRVARREAHQVVCAPVDPPSVAVGEQGGNVCWPEGEDTAQVPAGQRKHARLPCVVHG